jgi:hypothetical protein
LSSNLLDDLTDWKTDLRKRHFTYLLTTAISDLGGWQNLQELDAKIMQESIGKYIYSSGFVERYLARAISYLDRSAESAVQAECRLWVDYINLYKSRVVTREAQISSALRELVAAHG